MPGYVRLAVAIGTLTSLTTAVQGVTLEYALAQPPCKAYIRSIVQQLATKPQPEGRVIYKAALDLQLTNLGKAQVTVPWQLTLYSPGYLQVASAAGLNVLPSKQNGTLELQSSSSAQVLQPQSGSAVNLSITLEGSSASLQPYQETPAFLTTVNGQIYSTDGVPVDLKGVAYFGFDDDTTAPGVIGTSFLDGFWEPELLGVEYTGLSMELDVVIQRLQLLGFNTVRLPFTFGNLYADGLRNWTLPCKHPPLRYVVQQTVPPELNITVTAETLDGLAVAELAESPPGDADLCNVDLPNDSVLSRYIWTVDTFARNGFYIVVAAQSLPDTLARVASGNLTQDWTTLISLLSEDPVTRMRLILDPLNEPDQLHIGWTRNATDSLPGYEEVLTEVFGAVYPINPYMLLLVQGTGQKESGLVDNWGDGLITDKTILAAHPLATSPQAFFEAVLQEPYLSQVVISPHVYPPSISLIENGTSNSGSTLFQRLSDSFGYLNLPNGFCSSQGDCHQFAVVIGEMGSGLYTDADISFMLDLGLYLHNVGAAEDGRHSRIGSWTYWAWNANALQELGLVEDDWMTIKWETVELLQYLGLQPWYAASTEGHQIPGVLGTITDTALEPVPNITVPAPPPPLPCPDMAPDNKFTCTQQAFFGACDKPFMLQGQFCAYSCGRCSSYIYSPPPPGNVYCADLEPGGDYTCQQQAFIFNKCDADFIIAGGFCKASCNRCPGQPPAPPPACSDLSPDGLTPCQEERQWGKCKEPWMLNSTVTDGAYCALTCFGCNVPQATAPAPAPGFFDIGVDPVVAVAPEGQPAPVIAG